MRFGYVHSDSFVHRLDPRIKLFWFVAVTLVMSTWLDPIWVLALYVSVLAFAAAARIPMRDMLKGLIPAIPISVIVFLLNLFLHDAPGEPVFLGHLIPAIGGRAPIIPVYLDTLVFSVGLVFRIFVILSSVMLLMKILSPSELALALVKLGLPAEVGMAISISIAYVPVLINQISEVVEAQQSRGWRAGSGNVFSRIRSFIPVMIPTFFRSYVASEEMAAAMLARGFGFDMRIRTEMNPLLFRTADKALALALLIFTVVGFTIGLLGYTDYQFTLRLLLGRGA